MCFITCRSLLVSIPDQLDKLVCNNYKDITIDSLGKEQSASVTEKISVSIKPFMYFVVDAKTDNTTIQSIFLEVGWYVLVNPKNCCGSWELWKASTKEGTLPSGTLPFSTLDS